MERGFSGTYSGRCLPTWTFRILFSVESAFPQITIVSCGKTRRVSGIRHRRQILGFAFATGHTFRIAPRRQNVDHLRAWRPERETKFHTDHAITQRRLARLAHILPVATYGQRKVVERPADSFVAIALKHAIVQEFLRCGSFVLSDLRISWGFHPWTGKKESVVTYPFWRVVGLHVAM